MVKNFGDQKENSPMKVWKTGLLILAILSWSLIFPADKAAAEITNASQLVNMYGSSTTGVIDSLSLVLPNGTLQANPIPQGKAVVIQFIYISCAPNVSSDCRLVIGSYYNRILGWCSSSPPSTREFILPIGFAVSDNNALNAKVVNTATALVVPGKLEVQLIGYVLPLTAGRVPLELLLGKSPGLKNLMAQALLPNAFPRIAGQFPQGAIARQ
jgi:hypothetical protein